MNREIKFRAWDKLNNNMNDWEVMSAIEPFETNYSFSTFRNENLIFMQFTGLLDKNGVEIYEGDIVRGRDGDIYSVVFENAAFRTNGIVPHPKYFSDDEVIGNVWENGELLK